MTTCPRCSQQLQSESAFCPHCGAQLRVQPVSGEVLDPASSTQRRVPNPWVAAALSVIPGLGHLYAGAPVRGLIFLAAVVGPEVLGTDLDLTVVGDVIGIPLNIGGLGVWAFCFVDAYRTARRRGIGSVT